jgi:hypothetical protein
VGRCGAHVGRRAAGLARPLTLHANANNATPTSRPRPVRQICARLAPQGFGRPQVEAALNFLQNEAHAYTTCDDNHWKAT